MTLIKFIYVKVKEKTTGVLMIYANWTMNNDLWWVMYVLNNERYVFIIFQKRPELIEYIYQNSYWICVYGMISLNYIEC